VAFIKYAPVSSVPSKNGLYATPAQTAVFPRLIAKIKEVENATERLVYE